MSAELREQLLHESQDIVIQGTGTVTIPRGCIIREVVLRKDL